MADKEQEGHGSQGSAGHSGGGHSGGEGHSGGGGGGHGGGHEEGHEGAPEWLISFADNTALMMGFFVILLCLNMGPKGHANAGPSRTDKESDVKNEEAGSPSPQELDWVLSVRRAFNNPVNINSTNPKEQALVMRLRELQARRKPSDDAGVHGDEHKTQSIRESNYHNLYAYVPFDNESATVTEAGKQTVTEAADKLRGVKLIVEIRGHASAAEAYDRPDRAMQLSFDRALSVAHTLSDSGLDWRQLRLVPCGDNDRIRPLAYDRPGHAKNECVEVVVTDELLKD
jgi:flagellar motor protein MotB